MNEQLSKGLDLLISHSQDTMTLERLVTAMETCLDATQYDGSLTVTGDCILPPVQPEAIAEPKHILEDYQITEKDVGSLVLVRDDDIWVVRGLDGVNESHYAYPFKDGLGVGWAEAIPYLDPIALHFRPFYATPDSVAPDDLGEHFAVLFNDGDVVLAQGCECAAFWQNLGDGYEYIIGYRPLKFVNPLKQDK